MDADALVGRGDRHLVAQFATRRIRASARLFRSVSRRVSPPSPRSRASISNSRQAATRAVPDCPVLRAMPHKIARTSSRVCSSVALVSGGGDARVMVAFGLRDFVISTPKKPPHTRQSADEIGRGYRVVRSPSFCCPPRSTELLLPLCPPVVGMAGPVHRLTIGCFNRRLIGTAFLLLWRPRTRPARGLLQRA